MRTKLFLMSIFSLILMSNFFLSSCHREDKNDGILQVAGVEFAPNCLLKNDTIVGIDADIADTAMLIAGVDWENSVGASWDEAYNATLKGPNRALLMVRYSAARKDLFKWAGPTSQGIFGIFIKGATLQSYPLSLEACKNIGLIAVVRDWQETITLEDLGFQNLLYYDTYSSAIAGFMNGEVNFIASDFFHLIATLPSGTYLKEVNAVTRYQTVYNFIAFSKDVSDDVVERVQNAIETLIEDQSTVSIMRRYIPKMPSDYMPGTVQLFTEIAPPYNYRTGRNTSMKAEGFSVEIVNEIQTRNGYVNRINLSTWTDAYTPPQYLPYSAVFSAARTPQRESMFQWVGPLCTFSACFYTLANSEINIQTLEQAKSLRSIATPKDWYTHDFLTQNNFKNIVATSLTSQEAFSQLIDDEVEALLMTEGNLKWLANENGVLMSELTKHIEALNFDAYIAFSLNTPSRIVQQWQNNLNAMKADGTFETIRTKWFGN